MVRQSLKHIAATVLYVRSSLLWFIGGLYELTRELGVEPPAKFSTLPCDLHLQPPKG